MPLYDWECLDCGAVHEYITPRPMREGSFECKGCCNEGETADLVRRLSAPARYLGKRLRHYYKPEIHGGRYDTMGDVQAPKLPDLPGAAEADAEYTQVLDKAKTMSEVRDAVNDCRKDAPTLADYHEHFKTPEFREAKRVRSKIIGENQTKKARANAGVSPREKPLAGDAKELHR